MIKLKNLEPQFSISEEEEVKARGGSVQRDEKGKREEEERRGVLTG